MKRARRPLFLVGLGARTPAISSSVRSIAASLHIPALTTYKAKGVIPDDNAWFGGIFTNGVLERPLLESADLFIAVGLDPVELLPRRWTLPQPIISINPWAVDQDHIPILEEIVGDVALMVDSLTSYLPLTTDWSVSEVAALVDCQRIALRPAGHSAVLLPHEVVEIVAEFLDGARATVDAGAHMFPVMSLWRAHRPCGVLISNGLSTMGFAVPAAIGAALLDRPNPVVAFTGDGGLLMCLGELQTAAREQVPIRIIVFDDRALSLIRIKQQQRGYASEGTDLGRVDWHAVGTGLGLVAHHVESAAALRSALAATAAHPGPVLIAAKVSPSTYLDTIRALRG